VCDHCKAADGTVRKRKCPSEWCRRTAMCAECWKTKRVDFDAFHMTNRCAAKRVEQQAQEQRRADLIASGVPVRGSARTDDQGRVHVLFATTTGWIGYYMSEETNDAVRLLDVATPDDYRKFGELQVAPNDYVWTRAA
jgi:hypothetical protein